MIINKPKQHGYYTFPVVKPWLIFEWFCKSVSKINSDACLLARIFAKNIAKE